MSKIVEKLVENQRLEPKELSYLLEDKTKELRQELADKAQKISKETYDNKIYIRGLIEYTNFCNNDCYYCGIRKSNKKAKRYRLTEDDILKSCENGYRRGFRTFVIQGGEDPYFNDQRMIRLIQMIHKRYSDCAITLSIGEKPRKAYEEFRKAGAERYLLRHETANKDHYCKLHPKSMSFENRMRCLKDLKSIGFQVGAGFMVGSPYQKIENLVEDLLFIKEFNPEMIGIGPFIPHRETPFKNNQSGSLNQTLLLISILRIMLPKALIPATTALGTIDPNGRELGILAGANVVMPNLSPVEIRKDYCLYDNKICTGEEGAEGITCLEKKMRLINYKIVIDRGDYPGIIVK